MVMGPDSTRESVTDIMILFSRAIQTIAHQARQGAVNLKRSSKTMAPTGPVMATQTRICI